MRNVQQRSINAPLEVVGAILDSTSSANDQLWPSAAWPAIELDRGLEVGSRGGHGPIRYSVGQYEPGRRVRFVPEPEIGLDGYHEFEITPQPNGRTLVTHTIDARVRGRMRLAWPLVIRWMHEALLGDLLDMVERNATGGLEGEPTRWSPWVRLLRRAFRPRAKAATISR